MAPRSKNRTKTSSNSKPFDTSSFNLPAYPSMGNGSLIQPSYSPPSGALSFTGSTTPNLNINTSPYKFGFDSNFNVMTPSLGGAALNNNSFDFPAPSGVDPLKLDTEFGNFMGTKLPGGGGMSDWFSKNKDLISGTFGALESIGSTVLGYKNYGLAKDQFNFQKEAFNKNYANQVITTNNALYEQARRRRLADPTAETPEQYLAKHGVK